MLTFKDRASGGTDLYRGGRGLGFGPSVRQGTAAKQTPKTGQVSEKSTTAHHAGPFDTLVTLVHCMVAAAAPVILRRG